MPTEDDCAYMRYLESFAPVVSKPQGSVAGELIPLSREAAAAESREAEEAGAFLAARVVDI